MLLRHRFLLISFVEGASVMAAEISGARLLAPFFGSSLPVWSAVMAVTLAGLASGYFLGGRLSRRPNREKILLVVLLAAACALLSMTFLGRVFYLAGAYLPLLPAVVLSVVVLIFPATLFMGATSPLIIAILTQEHRESGANSGKIYAISTLGGILATFLCGFYLLPVVGVKATLSGFAGAMFLVSVLVKARPYPRTLLAVLFLTGALAVYGFVRAPKNPFLVYEEEGILGKLEIREEPPRSQDGAPVRKLLINTIVQTEMDVASRKSVSAYVNLLERNLDGFPAGKALVLGLGGGLVANMLAEHQYQVKGVEFDQRVIDMAKHFFYLNPSVETVCDDARHFLNADTCKWSLVLFDIFKAEEQPAHVITRQSLRQLKTLLDTDAVVLINTHGYLTGEKGRGTLCLIATLADAGFHLRLCASADNEAYRNLLVVASLRPFSRQLYHELPVPILTPDGPINDDDRPVMEQLNAAANQEWRSNYIRHYIFAR